MPGGAVADFKLGFWVGLGIVLAMAVWAVVQGLFGKLTNRGGQ